MSSEQGVQCDRHVEWSKDDANVLDELTLTERELELHHSNPNEFWQLAAEKMRVTLHDNLQEEQELIKLKEELQDEDKKLRDETNRLEKLKNQAEEIANDYYNYKYGDESENGGGEIKTNN